MSKKITYIALLTAVTIVANTFLEYKFFAVQFSLTIVVSVLAGVFLGSVFGFVACFLGDLIGFFLHPFGVYLPFIGIATGLMAVFGYLCIVRLPSQGGIGSVFGFVGCFLGDLIGFILHPFGLYLPFIGFSTGLMAAFGYLCIARLPSQGRISLFLRILLANFMIFVVCTSGITTLTLNLTWYQSLTFFECLTTRLFVEGQIWNTIFNAVVLFITVPALSKVKTLGLNL